VGTTIKDELNKNPNPFNLTAGSLITVRTPSLEIKYNIKHLDSRPFQVGILVSDAYTLEPLDDLGNNFSRARMYYKKLYKVLICGKIIPIYREDITEVL